MTKIYNLDTGKWSQSHSDDSGEAITVQFLDQARAVLLHLAESTGRTVDEVVRDALGDAQRMAEAAANGERVLFVSPDGSVSERLSKPHDE